MYIKQLSLFHLCRSKYVLVSLAVFCSSAHPGLLLIFRAYHCPKTKEMFDNGCRCFPAHCLFQLHLCHYFVEVHVLTAGSVVLTIFFHRQNLLKRLHSFIFLLTFLLLFIAFVVVLTGLHCGGWNGSSDLIYGKALQTVVTSAQRRQQTETGIFKASCLWKFVELCLSYF